MFLTVVFWTLSACSSTRESISNGNPQSAASETPKSQTAVTEAAPTPIPTAIETAVPATLDIAPSIEETAETITPIDDAEAAELMQTFLSGSASEVQQALDRIEAAQDERFIPVLIDAFRGWQLRLLQTTAADPIVETLETLSGQSLSYDWPAWVEWYGNTELEPPPGFTDWKGRMLLPIDPRFGEFLQDSHPSNLRPEEIQWGGVVVDGIPALDNPQMLAADKATYLEAGDAVFGIALNGEARAYPLRILDWHEMANDVVGGVPVSLAYCTLCGAAIAYNGEASDGNSYTFGSSGFLYRSNKLMYDRQTRTLWNQLTGEPVLGQLVEADLTLELLPVVLTTWQEWQNQHPDTLVVDVETGFPRNYTAGAAYGNYFADSNTMFPVAQRSDLLPPKSQIYALRVDGVPKAYPLQELVEETVANDTIGSTNLVLVTPHDLVQVEGDNQYVGEVTYQAGAEVRAYAREDHIFSTGPDAATLLDDTGQPWQLTEDALLGHNGKTLPRLPGHLAYWFGWYAFFPDTLVYDRNAQ
jgi:hypothetical protein